VLPKSPEIHLAGLEVLIVSSLVGAVFLRSALGKATDIDRFRRAIARYRLPEFARHLAWPICVFEFGLAGVLISGVAARPALIAAGLVLLLLSGLMAVNLAQGNAVPCGCGHRFSEDARITWNRVAAQGIAGAAIAVAALAIGNERIGGVGRFIEVLLGLGIFAALQLLGRSLELSRLTPAAARRAWERQWSRRFCGQEVSPPSSNPLRISIGMADHR